MDECNECKSVKYHKLGCKIGYTEALKRLGDAARANAIEEIKEKASYYYKQFKDCMDILYELDELEADAFWQYLETIGGGI